MRLILLLLLCTHLYAKSSLEFSAGIANSKSLNQQPSYEILYAKQIQKRSGYFFGARFSQHMFESDSFIRSIIHGGLKIIYPIKRTPFHFFADGGVGISFLHKDLGNSHIIPKFGLGMGYNLSRSAYITARYEINYGESIVSNKKYSFDGSVYTLGIGLKMPKQRRRVTPKSTITPRKNSQRRVKNNRRQKAQSTYQKTQQLMNELSWPTY